VEVRQSQLACPGLYGDLMYQTCDSRPRYAHAPDLRTMTAAVKGSDSGALNQRALSTYAGVLGQCHLA
jgi:hypothetical protein